MISKWLDIFCANQWCNWWIEDYYKLLSIIGDDYE